ncbi:lysozyme inhibitor LprI family protein [Yoonia sp. SS1-5]|uniref:Lysozyme inhibitor LprI family protein n=1 Tax=Yoonia rhodophyticola TaxID=3137370 RepID=A0AAN0NHA6_9RHOB
MTSTGAAAQELGVDAAAVRACHDSAQGWDVTPDCIGAAANLCQETPGGSTTVGIGACLAAEIAVWDEILNEEYQARRAEFSASAAELADALRDAQRAWIAFRDADCDLRYTLFQGGSIRSIVGANCRLSKTAQRAIELRDIGDL